MLSMKSAETETGLLLQGLCGNDQSKPPIKKGYNEVVQQLCLEDIGGTDALRIPGSVSKGILENVMANKGKHKGGKKLKEMDAKEQEPRQ